MDLTNHLVDVVLCLQRVVFELNDYERFVLVPGGEGRALGGRHAVGRSSVAPGCDFRTGCLTVLTVALTDIQLWAATKSLSSKFRSADHRDKLRSLVARFSTNLCPGCAPVTTDEVQNRRF